MGTLQWVFMLIFLFIFTLAHELGHAAMSRIFFNDKAWVIVMGSGKPIIQTKRLIINAWFFIGGYIIWATETREKYKHVLRCAGGFIVNLIFAAISILFILHYVRIDYIPVWWEIADAVFLVNVYLAVLTIIPITYPALFGVTAGMPSDGLTIWRLLTYKGEKDASEDEEQDE